MCGIWRKQKAGERKEEKNEVKEIIVWWWRHQAITTTHNIDNDDDDDDSDDDKAGSTKLRRFMFMCILSLALPHSPAPHPYMHVSVCVYIYIFWLNKKTSCRSCTPNERGEWARSRIRAPAHAFIGCSRFSTFRSILHTYDGDMILPVVDGHKHGTHLYTNHTHTHSHVV